MFILLQFLYMHQYIFITKYIFKGYFIEISFISCTVAEISTSVDLTPNFLVLLPSLL